MSQQRILHSLAIASLLIVPVFAAPKVTITKPDFTKGDPIPAGATHDWNLGATGLRGWMFSDKLETSDARQVRITKVEKGSPADGKLEVGDVILGVGGKPFSYDPRTEFGKALTAAEAADGKLSLTRWKKLYSNFKCLEPTARPLHLIAKNPQRFFKQVVMHSPSACRRIPNMRIKAQSLVHSMP
jgi:hypothetical protein